MKRTWFIFLIIAAMLTGILGCAPTEADVTGTPDATETPDAEETPVELLVSAAASLTDVMAEVALFYKDFAPRVTITYIFGNSGSLQTQIEEGAPVDVFLSAGNKQMSALEEGGLLLDGTNTEWIENKVVLIVPKESELDLTSFEDVALDTVKMVALGEPEGVPVGLYSAQVFTTLGILDAVNKKANYGSDVRQVLTWVEYGEVDCGVVYATDAATSDEVTVICHAPEESCDRILYPAAVIGSTVYPDEAKAFLEFLKTPGMADLFESYGFMPLA
jgi:molybdate transport system substrate-binding protein